MEACVNVQKPEQTQGSEEKDPGTIVTLAKLCFMQAVKLLWYQAAVS